MDMGPFQSEKEVLLFDGCLFLITQIVETFFSGENVVMVTLKSHGTYGF